MVQLEILQLNKMATTPLPFKFHWFCLLYNPGPLSLPQIFLRDPREVTHELTDGAVVAYEWRTLCGSEGERRMRVGATPAVTRCPWASLPRVLLLAVSQLLILRCSRPLRMSHRTSLTAYNPFRINPLRVSYRPLLEPTFPKFEGKNQRRLLPRCRAPTWILWSRPEHLPSVLRPSSQEHIPPASCWRIKGRNKSESKKSPNLE